LTVRNLPASLAGEFKLDTMGGFDILFSVVSSINGYFPQSLRWAANFNPQNTQCIPPVEILARLDLAKTISFVDGH
jgi:hypothetical protein